MRRSLLGILLLAMLAVACGGNDTGGTNVNPVNPQSPSGTVNVRFVLQARAVPAVITQFRFYGLDAAGSFTFGPVLRDKAALVTLSGVPTSTVTLRIEYLQNGVVRGLGNVPIAVPADGTVEVVDPPFQDVGDPLERIEITPLNPRIPAGVSVALRATAVNFDGTREDVTSSVQWSSSNPAVATVGNEPGTFGVARGLTAGATTVSATLRGRTDSTTLTVTAANLTRVAVGPNNPVVGAGTRQHFRATGIFSDGSSHDLTNQVQWVSATPAVAQISNETGQNGVARALAPGSSVITATHLASGLGDTTTLTVTAAALLRLEVTPGAALVPVGLHQQFDVVGIYADGSKQDLTSSAVWSSSHAAVAEVSNSVGSFGRARALAVGNASITATFGGLQASGALTVTAAQIASLAIEPVNAAVPLGLTQPMRARATLTDGNVLDVTGQVAWSTDNNAIAEVSNSPGTQGLLSTVAVGATVVRASIPGGPSAQTNISVIQAVLQALTVIPDIDTLPLGECAQYFAFGDFSDGVTRDVTSFCTWSSSDENVGVVENFFPLQGRVFATGLGTCTITAVEPTTGLSDGCPLTVTNAVLVSLAVEPDPVDLKFLQIARLRAIGTFSDGTTEDVTASNVIWSTSNPASAVVSNLPFLEGVVLAILPGRAIITATHSDGPSGSATVDVSL